MAEMPAVNDARMSQVWISGGPPEQCPDNLQSCASAASKGGHRIWVKSHP